MKQGYGMGLSFIFIKYDQVAFSIPRIWFDFGSCIIYLTNHVSLLCTIHVLNKIFDSTAGGALLCFGMPDPSKDIPYLHSQGNPVNQEIMLRFSHVSFIDFTPYFACILLLPQMLFPCVRCYSRKVDSIK